MESLPERHDAESARNRLAWVPWATGVFLMLAALAVWTLLDVDRDGISNMQEFQDGTQAFDGDSDGDGFADGWERDNGLDPLEPQVTDPSALAGGCTSALTLLCQEGNPAGEESVDGGAAPASMPVTATVVYGGLTSLVAGIGARLTSHFILTRH